MQVMFNFLKQRYNTDYVIYVPIYNYMYTFLSNWYAPYLQQQVCPGMILLVDYIP